MAAFMASMIIAGKVSYQETVTKRPDLKDAVDIELVLKGREDLIVPPTE